MASDGYTDRTRPRQARKAELAAAATELRLADAWLTRPSQLD